MLKSCNIYGCSILLLIKTLLRPTLWDKKLTETCMCHQSHLTPNHIGAIMPSTNIYWITQK